MLTYCCDPLLLNYVVNNKQNNVDPALGAQGIGQRNLVAGK